MKATIPYIEKKFDEFNRQMFADKLPPIPILLSDAGTFLGKCVCRKRRGRDGKPEFYDFKLRINARIDLPEQELEDTLIHEMIHYYIRYHQLQDTSAHGQLFLRIMNTINERFGRHVAVSFKGTKEQNEQLKDKTPRYHVVALVAFSNGNTGLKVLPRIVPRILKYYNTFTAQPNVLSVKLYMSNDIYFNRYPNSSTLKAHIVDKAEVLSHLQDAEYLPCDGKSIRRTK